MRVCFDTNALIQIFTPRPPFTAIRLALLEGEIEILISAAMFLEYEEVIRRDFGDEYWNDMEGFLAAIAGANRNVIRINPSFRFSVINTDADDNKFCDCAIAGEADFVVTYDRHFSALSDAGYKPQPITPDELEERLS